MCRDCENWECDECIIGEERYKCKIAMAMQNLKEDPRTEAEREGFFFKKCDEWEKEVNDLRKNCEPKKKPFFRFVTIEGRYTIA